MVEQWRVPPNARLRFLHFGDESALFDPRSGLTHFVNSTAVAALDVLAQEPMTVLELAAWLKRGFETPPPDDLDEHVARLVRQLANLDLIEAVSVHGR